MNTSTYIDIFPGSKIEIHPDSVNWGLAPGSIANFWGHAATWDLWWCAASVQAFEMFQHGASGAPSSLQGQPKSCNMPRSMKNPVASSPGSCEAIPPTCSTKYASQGEKFFQSDLRSCKNQAATKDIGSAESSPWRKQDQLGRHRQTLNLLEVPSFEISFGWARQVRVLTTIPMVL